MSSVSHLEGGNSNALMNNLTFTTQRPAGLLLQSPTFNTLDNRFDYPPNQLNPDSSRIRYGGLGATGS